MPKPAIRLADLKYTEWPDLVTPGEVASLFRVDPKTVTRWAGAGRIADTDQVRTMGGHRRFKKERIWELYNQPSEA